jgi:DNA primase
MKSNNMGYVDAIKDLAQQAGLKLPDYKPKSAEQISRESSYFEIYENATKIYQQNLYTESGKASLEYIHKRGFTDEVIKKYRLGYAPKGNIIASKFTNQKETGLLATGLVRRGDYGLYDFFRDRLMFPIFNAHGQIVAFSGRSLDGSEPKYINTSDTELFHKRQTIFGLNFARDAIYRANRSIVVEGQIDAIQMQMNGFPESVAPLGTALTEEHLQILCKSNRNITFCFDGDSAGQKAAARAAGLCAPFVRDNSEIKFAFVAGGKDPDDILRGADGQKIMGDIINSAISLVDFLWDFANKNYLIKTPGGQTMAHKFLMDWCEKIFDFDLKNKTKKYFKDLEWQTWKNRKNDGTDAPKIDADGLSKKVLGDVSDTAANLFNYLTALKADRAAAMREMTPESIARAKAFDLEITATQEKLNKLAEV